MKKEEVFFRGSHALGGFKRDRTFTAQIAEAAACVT
jgi:hypothetical protein